MRQTKTTIGKVRCDIVDQSSSRACHLFPNEASVNAMSIFDNRYAQPDYFLLANGNIKPVRFAGQDVTQIAAEVMAEHLAKFNAFGGDDTGAGEVVTNVWEVVADTTAEALNLKARSALLTALLVRVRGWNVAQGEAARRLGITRPRLNDLLRSKIHKFSLDALVNLLPAAGLELDLEHAIRPAT